MSETKRLVLVRHGESVINVVKGGGPFWRSDAHRKPYEHLSDGEFPLTDLGKDQARKTGLALKERYGVFDLVIHSSYIRAKETCDLILSYYSDKERKSMLVRETSIIRERDTGELFKLTADEVEARYPGWNNHWRTAKNKFDLEIPGGESIQRICEGRLTTFRDDLVNYFDHESIKSILVVSHGRAIQGMRYLFENWSEDRINKEIRDAPPNCSVTEYHYRLIFGRWERFSLVSANQVYY